MKQNRDVDKEKERGRFGDKGRIDLKEQEGKDKWRKREENAVWKGSR